MKPRILVLAQVYLPGYLAGGPIRSIANIVDWLSEDFEWSIVTTDRDLHGQEPYPDVAVDQWTKVGPANVFYASPSMCSPTNLLRLIRREKYDLLYLNSFFSPKFSVFPILGIKLGFLPSSPVLLAPRGEFSEGAFQLKTLKKRLFVCASRFTGLHQVSWHASTSLELADVVRVMGGPQKSNFVARVFSARDLSQRAVTGRQPAVHSAQGCISVCFLSRVSPMKNLDFALKVLTQVSVNVVFDIYGPQEDPKYWSECEELIEQLPANISANYRGAVSNDRVKHIIASYDLFFLPTRGENFGHVLLEAWSAGVPVLTSDQTPWRLLQQKGVGWDIPLSDPQQFARVIGEVADWPTAEHAQVSAKCLAFAKASIEDVQVFEDNRSMFLAAMHH